MPRPRHDHPTPAELEVLKILWEQGPSTVREVLEALQAQRKRRAYTTVMSLLNVMYDKDLVARKPKGRAFVYTPKSNREKTLRGLVGDLLGRAFEGQAGTLVAHLLEQAEPSDDELEQIRKTIEAYRKEKGGA
jgi:BlaI family penicillinase repressor